ncbi:MAG: hypothetical protein WCG91_00065 [Candidatus Shapirobacteria bacterium]
MIEQPTGEQFQQPVTSVPEKTNFFKDLIKKIIPSETTPPGDPITKEPLEPEVMPVGDPVTKNPEITVAPNPNMDPLEKQRLQDGYGYTEFNKNPPEPKLDSFAGPPPNEPPKGPPEDLNKKIDLSSNDETTMNKEIFKQWDEEPNKLPPSPEPNNYKQ